MGTGIVTYGLGFVTYGVHPQTLTYPECIEGFVKYGDGYCHIWVRICHIWGPSPYLTNPSIHSGYVKVWYLSPRFVIYWNCPNIDKSHPLMTNHYTPSGQRKLQAMLLANERPGNLSCDVPSTNHMARFHHFISSKGSPFLKFSICQIWGWVLSHMG